jgi:quercetin dioxygenase-like cupin family protein
MEPEPQNLSDSSTAVKKLIEYQGGSVVSRTIIKKDAGTVTIFAFDAGEGLSEHTTKYDALITVVDGSAEITISGKKHTVADGGAHHASRKRAARRFRPRAVQNGTDNDTGLEI